MYTYVGKLNWVSARQRANNECITVVVPGGFALNDPICVYWQWTTEETGGEKVNNCISTTISGIAKLKGEYRLSFSSADFTFDGSVSSDFGLLDISMRDANGTSHGTSLSLDVHLANSVRVPSTAVYTGKLNWSKFALNEMVTLVLPGDVAGGAAVGLYHQWTVNNKGERGPNYSASDTLRGVTIAPNGDSSATFGAGYYSYEFTLQNSRNRLLLGMTNPQHYREPSAPYSLQQTDFRSLGQKKALLVRFGTRTDGGIFLVRDMLTKHLGFALADVEMCYFDVEHGHQPGECLHGQDPPTASRIKSKLARLASSAKTGDVRFFYVDARGTADVAGSDGADKGWVLAEDDEGTRTEVVGDEWLANTLRDNVTAGVNFTILSTSCIGGGMLDAKTPTPGIILAACHETQSTVKALEGMDPWTVAITKVIEHQVQRKRGVPSYTVLYDKAKGFIATQLAKEWLVPRYRGPSPWEVNPIPRSKGSAASNQDPQLSFYDGYIDADEERFLVALAAPNAGVASGEAVRYPKDQYPI